MSPPKIGLFILLCLTVVLFSASERVSYDNYRVYKVNAKNRKELAVLKEMEDTSDSSLLFLDGVHVVNKVIKVVVAPHKLADLLSVLTTNEIAHELVEENLQNALDKDDERNMAVLQSRAQDQWAGYQLLDFNYQWMQRLTQNYANVVTLIEGGKTYEKRSILGVKISYPSKQTGNEQKNKKKPGIFLEAGIHAREWISPATATYVINELLTSENEEIRELAEQYDWYIIPHANPDGYVYTHTTDRMWRKTRQPSGNGCIGTDPNRNWNVFWNTVGTSKNPCSDTYAGREANSEIEIKSLTNFITSLKDKIQLYISLHSFSQYLLYPNGHTNELPDNVEDYRQVYNATLAAISKRYGTVYTGGNIYDAIYPAAGSSVDYAYTKLGIRMAFCFELRPDPNYQGSGMQLPPEQIRPTAEETLDGILAMVRALGYFN